MHSLLIIGIYLRIISVTEGLIRLLLPAPFGPVTAQLSPFLACVAVWNVLKIAIAKEF